MTLVGTRFGDIEYDVLDVITFEDGLIGFPSVCQYIVLNPREGGPFRWLQSTEEAALAFLVTNPTHYVPNYSPPLPQHHSKALDLTEETPPLIFTTVNIPRGRPEEMTINLAGPLVVNAEERKGRQIVLEDGAYTTKHRVFQKADRVGVEAA